MKQSALISLPLIVSSLLLSPLAYQPIYAQSSMADTTAIPTRIDLQLNPGESKTVDLKIINGTDTLQYYTVTVEDFIVSDNVGTPIPVNSNISGRWSLKNWIKAPVLVPVGTKQTQMIKMTINVPRDANPGGHYAMITYMPNGDIRPEELGTTGAIISHRTGTLIYVTVKGDIKQHALIKQFSAPKFNEYGPIDFFGLIENQSDVHIAPKGTITIKNFLGQKVASLPVESANIFPESNREFTKIWANKWGYGRYEAVLELAYGTAGGMLTSTILFWLFPIRLVIYLLTLITAVLAIITIMGHKNRKHQQMLEAEVRELKKELDEAEKRG